MGTDLSKLTKPTLEELDSIWLPVAGKSHRDSDAIKLKVHTAVNFMLSCGFGTSAVKNALRGIDFSKAVKRSKIPAGKILVRWGPLKSKHAWFTVSGVRPDDVGIYAEAGDRGLYVAKSAVAALESRARAIKVTWDARAAVRTFDLMATQIARDEEEGRLRRAGASEAQIKKARRAILKIGQATRGGATQFLVKDSSAIQKLK